MGAAALVRCADDDMILSNDHVLARTLDQTWRASSSRCASSKPDRAVLFP